MNNRIIKAACFSTDGLQKSMADCVHFNSALTCRQMFLVMILYGPPKDIPTLAWWQGLCGHMIPRAMLVVAYATGRASQVRQVKGDDPDEKGYSGPPGWGLGMRLTTSPCKKNVTKPQAEAKAYPGL